MTREARSAEALAVAADLIAADESNRYLVDARGYLQAVHSVVAGASHPAAVDDIRTTAISGFGSYAARSGATELADLAFESEDVAGKWRLLGLATVAGTIDQHSDWQLRLESDELQQAASGDRIARVGKLVTQTRIALADYGSPRASEAAKREALSHAVGHKDAARSAIANSKWQLDPGDRYLSYKKSHRYAAALDQLFAERGLWKHVDDPRPAYPLGQVIKGNQLVAKAALGALTRSDRKHVGRSFGLQELLDVNAFANGVTMPEARDHQRSHSSLFGNRLLAAAAPEAFVQLGFAPREQLDAYLKVGKLESAANVYAYMQQCKTPVQLLLASLMMALHAEDLRAIEGANGVYRGIVGDRITYVEDYTKTRDWRALPAAEADAMQPIVKELGDDLYMLGEPAGRLLAAARQLGVAVDVDPTSDEAERALDVLRSAWDELERMESYNDALLDLATTLKETFGVGFVNQRKSFSLYEGYVGYGLVVPGLTPDLPPRGSEDGSYFALPRQVKSLAEAARKINELHDEQRFVLVEYPETKPGEGDESRYTLRRVSLEGSWRQRGIDQWEVLYAEHVNELNTLPDLTDRLMALHLAD